MSTKEYTETWLTGPQSTEFYTRTYLPSTQVKAAVVYVHGFAEHVGRYTHFHPLLAKRGIAVFAYDQRGFGLTALDTQGKKSRTSSWGKTTWALQLEDIDWAIRYAKDTFNHVPIFLIGHSMGGGEVLGFGTQGDSSPLKSTIASLAGVVATSPLITQAVPAPKVLKWIGAKASILSPWTLIPAGVKSEELSHDEVFNDAYMKDPLIKQSGSLRGINDMITKGERLLRVSDRWPKSLPLLVVHGTEDKVTSHKSSQAFVESVTGDKKISLFEGGFHELQNEPDGVKERLAEEIYQFIETHLLTVSFPARVEGEAGPAASPPKANL